MARRCGRALRRGIIPHPIPSISVNHAVPARHIRTLGIAWRLGRKTVSNDFARWAGMRFLQRDCESTIHLRVLETISGCTREDEGTC